MVVGAGAAGLMAATEAALAGARVLLLEKNRRPGLKVLISGGGRCNLTTTRRGRDLEAQYGERRGRWLRPALRAFQPAALCALIDGLGVPLQEEDLEKVFPCSARAADVLDALLRRAAGAGVELRTAAAASAIARGPAGFTVALAGERIAAGAVVVTTGGRSYPKTGTTGDGYAFARALGHRVTDTVPALAPLAVGDPWVVALQGIVVDAALTVRDPAGRVLARRRRPTLFTHKGLSGPGPMDVSGSLEECPGARLRLDFVPDATAEELDACLRSAAEAGGRRAVSHALPRELPERLRAALCELAGAAVPLAELRRDARRALLGLCKDCSIDVRGSLGFAHAEVTRGGVDLDEVDPKSMASRLVPGLYFAGEVLDVDGPIGGFNFQAAFATGRIAGRSAAAAVAGRDPRAPLP